MAGNSVHSDLGPDDAAGALFGWLLTMLGQMVGFPVPEGGAVRITEALVRRLTGVLPERPFVLMGQMSTTDPSRSPPGTEAVWAYTHVPRRDLEWTAARRERFADRIQTVVERHAPGFTGRILGRAIQSPIELEQHNAVLVGGAINQGTSALHQQLIFQPTPGLGRADTPVDRVFLAGPHSLARAHGVGSIAQRYKRCSRR
ncbi:MULTISPECIES: phytoene desaturase family protein [Rhodococcus]|nr:MULTISPECIES: hypothetical protein [Rhodococcus]